MGRSQRASSHPRHSIPTQQNHTNPSILPPSLIYYSDIGVVAPHYEWIFLPLERLGTDIGRVGPKDQSRPISVAQVARCGQEYPFINV